MITVEGVSFSYHEAGVKALKDVSFTVSKGEFLAIVGPNGSGKSTMLRLLNGLLLPDTGRIFVNGLKATNPEERWQLKQHVGLVLQNPDNQLVASIVEDDIAFGPENLGLPSQEINARVQESLSIVGISHLRRQPPHLLSGGQKQLVAIAGVMAMRPEYLALDEPTSMLDPEGRKVVLAALKNLNSSGSVGVIIVTHHLEEAFLARRILVMSEGRVAFDGTPLELLKYRHEELTGWGLGLPGVVEIVRELRCHGLNIPFVSNIEDLIPWLI